MGVGRDGESEGGGWHMVGHEEGSVVMMGGLTVSSIGVVEGHHEQRPTGGCGSSWSTT